VLEIAKLEPRSATPTRRESSSVSEAIAVFFSAEGYLPERDQLRVFASREDFPVKASKDKPWHEWCAEASDLIEAQRRPRPNPYPSKIPPEGWQPRKVDVSGLPYRQKRDFTRLQVLEAVLEFKLGLRHGETPTNRRYKAFANGRSRAALGKNRVPSLKVIIGHGGLTALLRELAQPDWREQADREQALREQEAREAKVTENVATPARKPVEQKPRRRDPRTRMKFLVALRDHGPLATHRLAEILAVSRMSIWKVSNDLKERGLVKTTEENPHSPNQRYTLTVAGREALEDEPALRELLTSPVATAAESDERAGADSDELAQDYQNTSN
jgi:DNA-binding MarR family transcriptional regulator